VDGRWSERAGNWSRESREERNESVSEGDHPGVLQLAIVASLAAKYAIDRARFPRVWAQTVAYDPDLPIRGRYLSVRLRVDADRVYGGSELPKGNPGNFWASCGIYIYTPRTAPRRKPRSHADRTARHAMEDAYRRCSCSPQRAVVVLFAGTCYRSIAAPAGRRIVGRGHGSGKGPPRPIRLAVKKGDAFTPLEIK